MRKGTIEEPESPGLVLDEIVPRGGRAAYCRRLWAGEWRSFFLHESVRNEQGLRQVVRNGYLPRREVLTGAGMGKRGNVLDKLPKAVECLSKDREALLAFCDFPAGHWIHLRITNPIESSLPRETLAKAQPRRDRFGNLKGSVKFVHGIRGVA